MNKEELKKLFLSFDGTDYFKNVDFHIHSCESDGKMSPYDITESAKQAGMKYISIADHNTLDAYLSTNILREDFLIPAVEFDCLHKGILIHILGYGIDIDNEELKSLCARNSGEKKHNLIRIFKLRNPEEVIKKINNAGGIAVLAHPCCYPVVSLDAFIRDLVNYGLEGIEVYYPYKGLRGIFKFRSRKEPADMAEKYGLIKTGGSDSHGRKLRK